MGLFKNMKDDHESAKVVKSSALSAMREMRATAAQLQDQHADLIKQARSMDAGQQMAIGQRINHLMSAGIAGSGSVLSTRDVGPARGGTGSLVEFTINQTSGPGAPRQITVQQDMLSGAAAYPPGQAVPLMIDPNNPTDAMIGGRPQSTPEVRMARLEQLAAMHTAGALTDEVFAAKKAEILAED